MTVTEGDSPAAAANKTKKKPELSLGMLQTFTLSAFFRISCENKK